MTLDGQATSVPTEALTYGERLAVLRRYFSGYSAKDGYDGRRLTPARKAAITRKYREFEAFERAALSQPGAKWVPTRARSEASIEAVRSLGPGAALGYPKGLRGWAVVAVPGNVERVGVTRRGAPEVWAVGGVRMVFERFDPVDMATDPAGVAREMQRLHPKATAYAMRVGEYGWAGRNVSLAHSPEAIEGAVVSLLYRYGATVPPEYAVRGGRAALYKREPGKHEYQDFVTGMVAFYFTPPDPSLFSDYVALVKQVRRGRREARRSRRELMKGRQG